MNQPSRFNLAFKALLQLGPRQLGLYGLYQLGLRTGHYHRVLSASLARLDEFSQSAQIPFHPCLPQLPDRADLLELIGDQVNQLYAEADEIVDGRVRLFGGQPVPLELALPGEHEYWTKYETRIDLSLERDIKLI